MAAAAPDAAEKPDQRLALLPADAVTHHKITVRGQLLSYTATAGTLKLRDAERRDQIAAIFYVAYTLNGAPPAAAPGHASSSMAAPAPAAPTCISAPPGPRVLNFPAERSRRRAREAAWKTPETWLGFTDMVFIDPVGTGYSLAAKPEDAPKLFWGVHQDAESLAKTIALWLTRNGRTASPKFLVPAKATAASARSRWPARCSTTRA